MLDVATVRYLDSRASRAEGAEGAVQILGPFLKAIALIWCFGR